MNYNIQLSHVYNDHEFHALGEHSETLATIGTQEFHEYFYAERLENYAS